MTVDGILHARGGRPRRGRDAGTPRRSRSSSDSATRKEPACRSAALPSWPPVAATWSAALDLYRPVARRVRGGRRPGARKPGSSRRWPGRTSGTTTPALARRYFLDSVQALHRRGERPWSRALADRARGHRGGRAPARTRRADRRRGGGLRPAGGHRHRLLRRDAGSRVRRAGTSSALGSRMSPAPRRSAAGSRSRKRSTWPGFLRRARWRRTPHLGASNRFRDGWRQRQSGRLDRGGTVAGKDGGTATLNNLVLLCHPPSSPRPRG